MGNSPNNTARCASTRRVFQGTEIWRRRLRPSEQNAISILGILSKRRHHRPRPWHKRSLYVGEHNIFPMPLPREDWMRKGLILSISQESQALEVSLHAVRFRHSYGIASLVHVDVHVLDVGNPGHSGLLSLDLLSVLPAMGPQSSWGARRQRTSDVPGTRAQTDQSFGSIFSSFVSCCGVKDYTGMLAGRMRPPYHPTCRIFLGPRGMKPGLQLR